MQMKRLLWTLQRICYQKIETYESCRLERYNINRTPEINGGHALKVWLLQIFNAIIQREEIPHTLNIAAISPVYKGGGKDPLERGSYRGISVTPVLSKLLETLILGRLLPVFEDLNIPNINQTGYRKHVSCTDAIFTTTEVLSHYLHESETTYLLL